jgi:hypothetical protein
VCRPRLHDRDRHFARKGHAWSLRLPATDEGVVARAVGVVHARITADWTRWRPMKENRHATA